jgi:hypothetical protein
MNDGDPAKTRNHHSEGKIHRIMVLQKKLTYNLLKASQPFIALDNALE